MASSIGFSTTKRLLLLSLIISKCLSLVQTNDTRVDDGRSLHDELVEQTRRLIQSVTDHATASSSSSTSQLILRGLQAVNDAALTTVLEDGTTVVTIQPICRALEQNFVHNVTCTCTGSSLDFFSITCQYAEQVCSLTGTTCGTPVLALSMVNFAAFSATTCVYNYTRNNVVLPDVCISLQTCPTASSSDAGVQQQSFCGCMAQVDGGLCSECSLCQPNEDGLVTDSSPGSATTTGIYLNCSNRNAEFITESCSALDLDLDVSGMSAAMGGFLPNFKGFCSQLESGFDNKIECDCSDSGGGDFNVTCNTIGEECFQDTNDTVCGKVQSLVLVEEGLITKVKACSDYSEPRDLEQTCVSFALEQNSDKEDQVVGCEASYAGHTCSCDLCNDGKGVNIDCTRRAAPWAVIDSCQPIKNVYEFFPQFSNVPMSSGMAFATSGVSLLLLCTAIASLF